MLARLTLEAGAAEPAMLDLLPGQIVNIGRNRSNTIVLLDPLASRFHAVVYLERDGWFVRDAGTGRFHVLDPAKSRTDEVPSLSTLDEPQLLALTPAGPHPAVLHADELTALFQFMTASLEETTSHGLVVQALRVVERQTGAAVCGYLGFDADDPEPRVVTPAEAKMDVTLSKLLTQRAQSGLRTVWLADPHGDSLESPSLIAFRDAVCVPLRCHRGDRDAVAGDEVLGALHAYKTDGVFNDREVRFCEVLAGCLANTLSLLRGRRALEADVLRSRSTGLGDQLIGDSPAITNLRLEAARLAGARCPVLIEGETGVGKELVALALHRLGPRNAGPLVALNCAVVISQLADAELFGHATGALGGSDRARPAFSSRRTRGRCSSTRSANCRWRARRGCCGCWRPRAFGP
jgi:Nif-specific regulatory protein